jgi:hypothetical protein
MPKETEYEPSLINDPFDFVPLSGEGKKWAKWFEGGELLTSLVSEAIEDFTVREETALERAHRRWGMKERNNDR